jgi:O-antigen ligase
MVWLIWELAFSDRRQTALLSAYVLGTFVSCFETIHNFLSGRTVAEMTAPGAADNSAEQRFAADGFNANEFALVLAISIPITFYLLSRKNRGFVQLLYWGQIVAAMTAILLTGSRGALMAAAIGLLMYFNVLRNVHSWQRYAAIFCAPLALTCAFIFVPEGVLRRFSTIGSEITEGTFTKRTLIWTAGLDAFRDHALFGVGSGAFGASVMNRLDVSYAAHNTFLSVIVELGAIGALIFAALLANLFSSAARSTGAVRSLWLLLLATWCVGVFTTTWEQRKPTWFLFGMLPAQVGAAWRARRVIPRPYELATGRR